MKRAGGKTAVECYLDFVEKKSHLYILHTWEKDWK